MPSLLDTLDAFSKLGKKHVSVHEAACVRVRHRRASCNACLRVCVHEAITIEDNTLAIENNLCTGCGACTSVCPTEALRLIDDGNEHVRRAIDRAAESADQTTASNEERGPNALQKTGKALTITCEYLRNQQSFRKDSAPADASEANRTGVPAQDGNESQSEGHICIPCLAALDEATLIHAACADAMLDYESADCARCPNRCGTLIGDIIAQAVRFCTELPGGPFDGDRIRPRWHIPAVDEAPQPANISPEMTRRGMFDHFVARTTDSVAEAAVSTFYVSAQPAEERPTLAQSLIEEGGTLRHITVERNAEILDDLYRRVDDQEKPDHETEPEGVIPTRLFGEVSVDESRCDLCGICMNFCPTGALDGIPSPPVNPFVAATRATALAGELTFRANDCVACHLCVDICPHDALELQRGIAAQDLFALEPHVLFAP